ncbi:MAG TPA: SRPBCC domain-containing protein, partial [Patescibacteria group bacterium]|nr:SRPBCC domain-containing protein [Patescibacteria group bacterium]
MGAAQNLVREPADRVLVIERVFDAPRRLVFDAWTQSEHMAKWWGPRGFKSTVLRNELRPGGAYRIHMLGPDGDHWTQGVYREVIPPERLVMVGSWADAQ